jgi:hypothetical protein
VFVPTRPRELENYLLNANAITTHLNSKIASADKSATVADVQRQLGECADNLQQVVLWKHTAALLKPIHVVQKRPEGEGKKTAAKEIAKRDIEAASEKLGTMAAEIEKQVDAIAASLNRRWDREKLLLVPGAALLDEIYKLYGFRFDKVRDGPKLASKLLEAELDDNLKSILRQMGSMN